MKEHILNFLHAECPWRDTLHWFDCIDSTNRLAKTMAQEGAPHGTVLIAGMQTGGRGRLGRSFDSQTGGVYLSFILRPGCKALQLMHLTCAAGVAACDAVQTVTGVRPGIKWINDLILRNRKVGGILTELSVVPGTDDVDFAIVGIGINCRQKLSDFPPQLQDLVTTLEAQTSCNQNPAAVCAALIEQFYLLSQQLFSCQDVLLTQYRKDCITLQKEVFIHSPAGVFPGYALDIDPQGGLIVRCADGSVQTVSSGEVSIRGKLSYI